MAYLDLNEEIYRIIRQLASGGTISDALLAKVCARFGLPQDSLHDLHRNLACPASLQMAQRATHMCNAVRALHNDTFLKSEASGISVEQS